jgi:glycerophosphoryl diester phosphodiesterase
MHDDRVDRTTNGRGLVKDLSSEELRQLDAGAWFAPEYAGQRVPILDEVLAWARQRGTVVDIEIKNVPMYYAGIESAVVKSLAKTGMAEQVIVISFDHRAVRRVKELDPRIVTGVLYAGRPVDGGVRLARQADADALLPQWTYVTPEDVRLAHAAGLYVAPWATSEPEALQRLIAAGVDAIGTNHPDILRRVLDERAAGAEQTDSAPQPQPSPGADRGAPPPRAAVRGSERAGVPVDTATAGGSTRAGVRA